MSIKYVKASVASEKIGLSVRTLSRYAEEGKIGFTRTAGGRYLYDVEGYMISNGLIDMSDIIDDASVSKHKTRNVCYCRVSTYDQRDDLDRQVALFKKKYPDHEIITDISSGINFKRPGLMKLIGYAIEGCLARLVVTYKDRLCRIGYDLVEQIMRTYSNTEIVFEYDQDERDINIEISKDVLEIITTYTAKIHGMRSHKNKNGNKNENKNENILSTKEDTVADDE